MTDHDDSRCVEGLFEVLFGLGQMNEDTIVEYEMMSRYQMKDTHTCNCMFKQCCSI